MGIKERAFGGHLGWWREQRAGLGSVQPELQQLGYELELEHRRSPTLLIISFRHISQFLVFINMSFLYSLAIEPPPCRVMVPHRLVKMGRKWHRLVARLKAGEANKEIKYTNDN